MRADSNTLEHLQLANDVRAKRADLKRQLAGGEISIITVLADPPAFCRRMAIADLLAAAPWFSYTKAERICQRARIAPATRVEVVSTARRRLLLDLMRDASPSCWRRWEAVVA